MTYRPLIILFLFSIPVCLQARILTKNTVVSFGKSATQISPVYQSISEPIQFKSFTPGKPRRTAGIIMVLVGASVQAAGIIKIKEGIDIEDQSSVPSSKSDPSGLPRALEGLGIFVIGTGIAVTGTILWIKGAKKVGTYKKEQQQSLRFKIDSGLSLAYQF